MPNLGDFGLGQGRPMDRRALLAKGLLVSAATLAGVTDAWALPVEPTVARLETRLFNLKPDLAPDDAAAVIARFKEEAKAAAPAGFLIGQNEDKTPFPTRFEWIYMVQWPNDPTPESSGGLQSFKSAQDALAEASVDQAIGEVVGPLPARFADAFGIGVRHVVMFSFKPQATSDDRARIVEAIRAMGRNSKAKRYLVEPHAPAPTGPDQMDWEVIGDFASMADFTAYALAPAHLAMRDDFTAHVSRVAFLDVAL